MRRAGRPAFGLTAIGAAEATPSWMLVLALVLATASAANAAPGPLVYLPREGDTPESLAQQYYGSRKQAVFIREANHLGTSGRLKDGVPVKIPGAYRIRVKKGDTLEGLADRLLNDKRRARFLGEWNGLKLSDVLREGADLKIPFHLRHSALAPESLSSLAGTFYNDPQQGKMLADYNFRGVPVLAKGESVVIPVPHVFVKSSLLASAGKALPAPTPAGPGGAGTKAAGDAGVDRAGERAPDRRPAEGSPDQAQDKVGEQVLAQAADVIPGDARSLRVTERLRVAEQAWRDGLAEEVVDQLTRLLAEEQPVEAQRAAVHRLRGFAYVAIGHDEPALADFRDLLRRDPRATFDAARVSPKIRAVFDRARADR